jgi:hypothetical protein
VDEGKHLNSLKAIDAAFKDLTAHLNALKELQGMSQDIQAIDTSMMTDPYAKQQQALQDNYVKQMQDTENYVSQKQALLDEYDRLNISHSDQRYQNELALLQKAKDKELGINKQYAFNVEDLDQQIAMAKAQVVSTSIGQVGQLMMTGNKQEFEAGKALAETEAAVSGALAVVKAYASAGGGLYGIAAGLGVAALVAVQIEKIEQQQYSGKAEGGSIVGGIPGEDSVHILAMPGEVMIKKQAVDYYGQDKMLAYNDMTMPRFADGGVVGGSTSSTATISDASSNVVDLTAYKEQKLQKEQLEATDTLVEAVNANTVAITKVSDGLTKIAGVFDSVASYFSGLTTSQGVLSYNTQNAFLENANATFSDAAHNFTKIYDLADKLLIDTLSKTVNSTITDIFGGDQSISDQGLQLGYSNGQLQAESYATIKTGGGLFGSNSYDTQTAALDASLTKLLDDTAESIKSSAINAAAALGQTSDSINSVVMDLTQLDLSGLSDEDASKAVEDWFQSLGNAFADSVSGLEDLVQPGENSYDALIRLAESLQTVNDATSKFGGTVMSLTLSSGDAASTLVDLMGGLDSFNTAVSNYESKMFTSSEQSAMDAAAGYTYMSNALAAVGYAVPATSDEFKAMVNSLDLTTTAGQDAYAAFMAVTDGAAAFYDQAKKVADATTALNNDLTVRSYTAAGDTVDASLYQLRIDQIAEVQKAEEDGLLTTEQITQLKIVQEEEWAKAVEDASATISEATQSLIDSSKSALTTMLSDQQTILNKMKGLLTTDSSLSPEAAYTAAQQNWQSALDSGDLSQLSDAAQTLLDASKAYNASGTAYQADYQAVLDALGTAAGIGTGATIYQVDNQITLLSDISDSLSNGDLATNTTLLDQLGTSGALYQAIQDWINNTNTGNKESTVAAASETFGKAYDTFQSDVSTAYNTYSTGGSSYAEYQSALTDSLSTVQTALTTATTAGVTNFTSVNTGQSYDIGSGITMEDYFSGHYVNNSKLITQAMPSVERQRTTDWASKGAELAYQWDIGTLSTMPDLQYDVAGYSYTDTKPNGIIDMNDYYALLEMAQGTRALPTYAAGGLASGWSIVGEEGPELVNFTDPGQVYPAEVTKDIVQGKASGGNIDALIAKMSEQIAETRALRQEIKEMKAHIEEVEKHSAAQVKVSSTGFSKTIEQADELNKKAAAMTSGVRLAALQR